MNNEIKTVVCLIAVLALSVCWVRADDSQTPVALEQDVKAELQSIDKNPYSNFLDQDNNTVTIWQSVDNTKNMNDPEKLRYWINYSYIIYKPKNVKSAVREQDENTVTIDFFIVPTFDSQRKLEALEKIKSLLPNAIKNKVTVEQIGALPGIKSVKIKSPYIDEELIIQDEFLARKFRKFSISKESSDLFFECLEDGMLFSDVEITIFDDEMMELPVILKESSNITSGKAFLWNIEEAGIRNQKEQRILKIEPNTSDQPKIRKETIEISLPKGLDDMIIVTNSIRIATMIKGTNAVHRELGEVIYDESLKNFKFDVTLSIPPIQIAEQISKEENDSILDKLKKWWSSLFSSEKQTEKQAKEQKKKQAKEQKKKQKEKNEMVADSSSEAVINISYDICKKIEKTKTVDFKSTGENELSLEYDPKKYTLQRIELFDEKNQVYRINDSNGYYEQIQIKNESGKVTVRF